MTREEKVAHLQGKATELLKLFEGVPLPAAPVKLDKGRTIFDVQLFYDKQLILIKALWADPFNRVFVNAYIDLLFLSTYLHAKTGTDHSKPGRGNKVGKPKH